MYLLFGIIQQQKVSLGYNIRNIKLTNTIFLNFVVIQENWGCILHWSSVRTFSMLRQNGNSILLRYVLHWYSDQKSWVNSWVHYFRLISLSVMTTKSSSRCYWYQFKFPVLLSCVWYLVFEKNWVKSCGWFPKRHVSKNGCKRVHTGLSFTKMFWVWPRRPTTKKLSLLSYNIYVH